MWGQESPYAPESCPGALKERFVGELSCRRTVLEFTSRCPGVNNFTSVACPIEQKTERSGV
jgi:hypothetical protein